MAKRTLPLLLIYGIVRTRIEVRRTGALRTLVVGYGNVNRGDDGLGYYVINELARRLGRPQVEPYGELPETLADEVDVLFERQLVPEMAELLVEYDRVFFVDAHTGAFSEDVREVVVDPEFAPSALTHHLTLGTLLTLTQVMFGQAPTARLFSGQGASFDFTDQLSDSCRSLGDQIADRLLALLKDQQ